MLQTIAPESILIACAVGLACMAIIAALLVVRAEKARARLAARLSIADERLRASDDAIEELKETKASNEQRGRDIAARDAELSNALDRVASLKTDLDQAREDARRLRDERDGLGRELAGISADIRGYERQINDLKEAKEDMRKSFGETASALLESHSKNFKNQNSEQIDALLKPLKNDIDSFKKSLGDAHVESAKQHGSLKGQIEQLVRQSALVSKEAENLTRALKNDTQLQGAWGEMKVETILHRLGFTENIEYSRQESFSDSEGRVRTDFIINLPQGERLIIDSKVSLLDFEAYINAADDETRQARLAAHTRSMRAHVKGLASKDYHARVGTRLDFVIMFVPIEGALAAALRADEALSLDALDLNVAIATPTTLTTQMKTVAAMWRVERQHQNAEEIADRAGKLYDKFVNFAGDLENVGKRLQQARDTYDGAVSKLTGAGGVIRQTEMLKALGAKTSKSISQPLLDAAGANDQAELMRIESPRGDEASSTAPKSVQ